MPSPKMPPTEPCSGCGAKMAKIPNAATGSRIPAQAIRTVYLLTENLMGELELQKVEGLPKGQLVVSHFETCPLANDFSRSRAPR